MKPITCASLKKKAFMAPNLTVWDRHYIYRRENVALSFEIAYNCLTIVDTIEYASDGNDIFKRIICRIHNSCWMWEVENKIIFPIETVFTEAFKWIDVILKFFIFKWKDKEKVSFPKRA